MEKPRFVKNGVLRLPPGFRFHPTDEELVVDYLRRKVFSYPLPASIIPEIDLGRCNPWDLLGGSTEERYLFNLREARYLNGSRANRAAGAGYWKATGKEKPVVVSRCNHVVGTKKVLVFYQGKPSNGTRTDWMMHEYRLSSPQTAATDSSYQKTIPTHDMVAPRPLRDWVLCRIFKKKRAARGVDSEEEFMTQHGNNGPRPSSPSSDSSCVTDVSSSNDNEEETCSCSSSTKSSP